MKDYTLEDSSTSLQSMNIPLFDEIKKQCVNNLVIPTKNNFIKRTDKWLLGSKLNNITGTEAFPQIDIINGVTHFIDNVIGVYNTYQTFENDYNYYRRLNPNIQYSTADTLKSFVPLIISMPFSGECDVHTEMNVILDKCVINDIPVFIDCAWLTAAKDITFNMNHPAIHSFAMSFSKGLNLGWNRIGLRWSRIKDTTDPITIQNDFGMYNSIMMAVAEYYMDRILTPDYLWNNYEKYYNKVCRDLTLKPSKIIHVAKRFDKKPWVGVATLINILIANQ